MNGKSKYNPDKHHRRSIRLKEYDYSQAGAYFVTICTQNREHLFGQIEDDMMVLSEAGNIVKKCWNDIPMHFPNVKIDEFVIMPNHIHGIIIIAETGVRANNYSPLHAQQKSGTSKTVGSIVRGFKIGITKWFRGNTDIYNPWQRNYYEHVVRDENDLNQIRQYIIDNPVNGESDENYIG